MKIDNGTLEKIRKMDDAELCEAVSAVASALGASEKQRKKALDNIPAIRRKINTAGERDIKNYVNKIGEDKAAEILKKLKM